MSLFHAGMRVLVLLSLLVATATAAGVVWHLSNKNENCDAACARLQLGPCNQAVLRAVDTEDKLKAIKGTTQCDVSAELRCELRCQHRCQPRRRFPCALTLVYHDFFSFFSTLTFDVPLTLLTGTVIMWAI